MIYFIWLCYDIASTLVGSGSSSRGWYNKDHSTATTHPCRHCTHGTMLIVSAAGTTDASSPWLWRGLGRGACLRSTCRPTASGRAWRASSTRRRDPWCWTEPPPPTPPTLSAPPSATDTKISSSKYVFCIFRHCEVHTASPTFVYR